MDFNLHDIPTPRPLSILLVGFCWGFHLVGKMTHDEVNNWLATIAGICALVNYIITWYGKFKRRKTINKNIGNNPKT